MKEYIGTKVVKAEKMNELTATEKGFARSNEDKHEWREGYHVQYINPDGSTYDSWSPKDVFEKAYKLVETPLDRLKIERNELKERIENIEALIGNGVNEVVKKAGGVPQAVLLILQDSYMLTYLKVLETRIDLMEDNK